MKLIIRLLSILGLIIAPILSFILWYGLFSVVMSWISVNQHQSQQAEVPIYILTNGVHTDIVVPTVSDQMDWRTVFSPLNTEAKDSSLAYTAIGWGDKGFYLNTPTWADLKFSTAFNAAFGLSQSALHVTYYASMKEDSNCKQILISKKNYARLINFIKSTVVLQKDNTYSYIQTNSNYGVNDAFYDAHGRYHFFKTCNSWANTALQKANQKAALWTPLDKGIFLHYN